MGDVLEAKAKLRAIAEELNARSDELASTSRDLEPLQEQYDDFVEGFEVALSGECEGSGTRLPSKDMRLTMALQAMPKEFRKQHRFLVGKRERLKQRISDKKVEADAWRSILSAEKTELEAIS